MFSHWAFAVFLLIILIRVEPRTGAALSTRQRRSVSHAQMLHDRSRSLQERKRRLWIQALLQQVHTAQMFDSSQRDGGFQTKPWSISHRPKHTSSPKTLPLSLQLDSVRTRDSLLQETSKTSKSAMKRKLHLS